MYLKKKLLSINIFKEVQQDCEIYVLNFFKLIRLLQVTNYRKIQPVISNLENDSY